LWRSTKEKAAEEFSILKPRILITFALVYAGINSLAQILFSTSSEIAYGMIFFLSIPIAVCVELIIQPVVEEYSRAGIIWTYKRGLRFIYIVLSNIAFLLPLLIWVSATKSLAEQFQFEYLWFYLFINFAFSCLILIVMQTTPQEPDNRIRPLRNKYEFQYKKWKESLLRAKEKDDTDQVIVLLRRTNKSNETALFIYWLYLENQPIGNWLLRFIEDTPFLRSIISHVRYYNIYKPSSKLYTWERISAKLKQSHAKHKIIPHQKFLLTIKRIADILLSLVFVLFVATPYILLVMVVLAIDFRGLKKAFFVTERVGQGGRIFRNFEFSLFRKESDGTVHPARIRSSLIWSAMYRLPELWNVIIGDMSIVGPYPMFELYATYRFSEDRSTRHKVAKRLSIRPGILDPTVIQALIRPNLFRCPVDCLDAHVEYVNKWNFLRDTRIFLRGLVLYYAFQVPNSFASLTAGESPPPVGTAPVPLPIFFSEQDFKY